MSLARVMRSFAAYGIGQVVTVLIQFALPPVFLRVYGVSGYATWVILWTTVAYMMSLNFGVTTYAVNRLTMMHKANDVADFQPEQASAAVEVAAVRMQSTLLVPVVSKVRSMASLKLPPSAHSCGERLKKCTT